MPLLPTYSRAVAVLQLIESSFPHLRHESLTIKQLPAFAVLYDKATQPISQEVQDVWTEEQGSYKPKPSCLDPFDEEPPLDHLAKSTSTGTDQRHSSMRRPHYLNDPEETNLSHKMETFERQQDGSPERWHSAKRFLERHLDKHPKSCRLAVAGLQILKRAVSRIKDEAAHQHFLTTGVFSLILRLMSSKPTSARLQGLGLECFFKIMGGYAFDESLPVYSVDTTFSEMTNAIRSLVKVTMLSLEEAKEYGGLKTLVNAVSCVVDQYNLEMTTEEKT